MRPVAVSECDLFLVRHGVTDWNETGRVMGRIDIGLNARGRAEAQAVCEALRAVPLRALIASPQRRTFESAELIAGVHALSVRTEPGLEEVWVQEQWQGKTWFELRDDVDLQRYGEDPAYACAAIEPAAQVQDRIVATAEAFVAQHAEGAVAIVSHGDPIKLLLAHHLSMPLAAYRRIFIDTGSVSVLRFSRSYGSRLLVLNWKPPDGASQLVSLRRG